jgi:hypothetical protein
MVGKIFSINGEPALFHESSGTQRHAALNSPGGLDSVVLYWLKDHDVQWVYHFDKKRQVLYRATVTDIISKGVIQKSGGRARKYLREEDWQPRAGKLPFRPPWIKTVIQVDADEKPKPSDQLELF